MYELTYANSFKRDYKRILKRGINVEPLNEALRILAATGTHADLFK